jgi:FkbM family methyltransferase
MSSIDDKTINSKIDAKKHALQGEKYLVKNDKIKEVLADTKTLNEILNEIDSPKVIDFLSLDVEGAELEVLNGINFLNYYFKFILVESRDDQEIIKYLKNFDYNLVEKISKRDLFFKHNKF